MGYDSKFFFYDSAPRRGTKLMTDRRRSDEREGWAWAICGHHVGPAFTSLQWFPPWGYRVQYLHTPHC